MISFIQNIFGKTISLFKRNILIWIKSSLNKIAFKEKQFHNTEEKRGMNMEEIKALFFDIDGTIVEFQSNRIRKEVVQAISKAH